MNKFIKPILEIALGISIVLNIVVITKLNNHTIELKDIELNVNRLSSAMNTVEHKIAQLNINNNKETYKEIITPAELAQYLMIDIDKVYDLIIDNPDSKFPRMKIESDIRFSKKAIDEYMLKEGNVLIK